MARKANEEMAAIRSQMAEQERRNQQNLERHQEALRRAEQLRAEERDAYVQRLQAEQEERRRESERAREQLEQQEREAEQRLVEELQRERDNVQKAKVEKWQRLKRDYPIPSFLQKYVNEVSEDAQADAARDRFVNVAMLGDSGTGKSSLIKVIQSTCLRTRCLKSPWKVMARFCPHDFHWRNWVKSLWDLPGQGTSKIPSMTYLCNMGLKYFDAVCIVTDGRWSEGDDNLLAAIHYAGIRCFVVRSMRKDRTTP